MARLGLVGSEVAAVAVGGVWQGGSGVGMGAGAREGAAVLGARERERRDLFKEQGFISFLS